MRRAADNTIPPGKIARLCRSEILLSHVTTVRVYFAQQVRIVVDYQRNAGGFRDREHHSRQIHDLGLLMAFGPELENVNSTCNQPACYQPDVPLRHIAQVNDPIKETITN